MEHNLNIIAIIQARMGSTRLPGKTLKLMNGKPMLEHLVHNIKKSKFVNKIIIATSDNSEDDPIESFCKKKKINYYRGSKNNVLSRFKIIADKYKPNLIVRLTGDNPFVENKLLDFMLKTYLTKYKDYDYINNVDNSNFPYGLYVEIFTIKALNIASRNSKKSDFEHVTLYIRRNKKKFKTASIKSDGKFKYNRLTVDNEKDFIFAEKLMKKLLKKNNTFTYTDFLKIS